MKKALFILLFFFILGAAGIAFYIFFLKGNDKGALQVTASPQSKVYLNGEYLGTTPLCRCPKSDDVGVKKVQEMLPVGEYTLRLVPTEGSFAEFQEKITIEKSVLTVVDRKFAEGASSEGVVISLTTLPDKKINELTIVSIPEGAEVFIDDVAKGKTPLQVSDLTESDHTLTLQKAGYKIKSIRIRATNGFKLVAKGYLGIDPAFIAGASEVASSSATPTPGISVTKIIILETGTGFLRVRDDSSLAGVEIGRVSPGEEYEVIEEIEGWYQISLQSGVKGWISAQYAQKKE
ncbi:MAG: hypothetical protein RLZZ455_495 [Candidatus Parcubacteria bacterium]